MVVEYIEQIPLGRYKVWERRCVLHAASSFTVGGLEYFRLDRFNYKTVDRNHIVRIDGVFQDTWAGRLERDRANRIKQEA